MRRGEMERFLALYKGLGLSDLEALAVMLVIAGYESNIQPSFRYLREKMTAGEKELAKIIARFVKLGWLRPLSEEGEYDGLKLVHLFNQWVMADEERQGAGEASKNTLKIVITDADLIEAELWFKRSFRLDDLTPMQKDEVHRLVKAYGKDLVMEALRQAVLNNKLTLSYIGGILKRWRRDGFKTVFEVRKALEKEGQRDEQRGGLKERRRKAEDADLNQYEELMELLLGLQEEQKDEMAEDRRRKGLF